MTALQPRSLQHRLVALMMVTSTVALVLMVLAFSLHAAFVVRREARLAVKAQAELFAANVSGAVAFDDLEHATRSLLTLRANPQFDSAYLFDEEGHVLTALEGQRVGAAPVLPSTVPQGVKVDHGYMEVWVPVLRGDARVGTFYLRSKLELFGARYMQFLLLVAGVLLASWLLALALASRLQRGISGPILELAETTRRVRSRKDYSVRATIGGSDELGVLADGFNEMLAEIQGRDVALQAAHDDLEQRVAERTQELKGEIARRARTEMALADEKERLAVTLRSIGDAVAATDAAGRIVLFNPVAEKLSGWLVADAIGRPLMEVLRLADSDTGMPTVDPVQTALEASQPVALGGKTVLKSRDGSQKAIADSAAPIRDSQGKVIGVVLVFRDVTEERRAAEELLRASKIESVGLLAGGIAHDFNNILMAILGNVSLARTYVPAEGPLAGMLQTAEKAAMRAGDLTRQLLTFAKGGAPIRQTASLGELVRESAEFAIHGSSVACRFEIADGLDPADVDAGQISQVVHNMVLNAVQAMPFGGTVYVSAANQTIGSDTAKPMHPGRYIAITIRDTGVGIPPENLSRIFDPYFTTKPQGSGLGLAASYSIVRQHDGHIEVESAPGHGSTFRIYLPATSKAVPSRGASSPVKKGSGRILVMDDEVPICVIVAKMLSDLGYQADSAYEGAAAVKLYREAMEAKRPYAAVILDLTVPGGQGGRETIAQLLNLDPNVKAIVSSGYSEDIVLAQYREHGFQATVPKPYTKEQLGEVLQEVLGGTGSGVR